MNEYLNDIVNDPREVESSKYRENVNLFRIIIKLYGIKLQLRIYMIYKYNFYHFIVSFYYSAT